MARYSGMVGFGQTKPNTKGQMVDYIQERHMTGEIVRDSYRHTQGTDKVNPDIVLVNTIRLLADWYAEQHFLDIRYVRYMGKPWKVQSIQYERPRITVTLGEVWNGSETQVSSA